MQINPRYFIPFLLATLTTVLFVSFQLTEGAKLDSSTIRNGLIDFAIVFVVAFLLLNFFVFRPLSKTYSFLLNSRNKKSAQSATAISVNEIENLNNEVFAWADERKAEIEQLQKLETYRKEFLGNVSHELKTPIFNIQGYVLTLLDGGLEDPKINKDYLQRADKSVERMIRIVEDLESITQLETGELEIDCDNFDLAALTKDIFESNEMRATQRGITLSFRDLDPKPIMVYADRFRIRQVLTNLIVNSIKYGKPDGETKVKFSDSGEKIIVEVSDNGIGIGKEHLPRLFERFYRVDKSRSRDQGGTGLGLAIVKHILEAHGQNISVMSTPNVGSVFSFSLKKAMEQSRD
jgi:two-component system phosphate regulon sensor histidine kinase PhoR